MKIKSGGGVMVAQQTFLFDGGGSIPTSPHQLRVKEIKTWQACSMNERWHSRLPKINVSNVIRNTYSICYGFFFGNRCLGVAIWSSPVAQNRFKEGKTMLELRRMALSSDCPKNTASRTLSIMVKLIKKKFPELSRLISYQDTAVHKGIIYKASGWTQGNETPFLSWTTNTRKRNIEQSDAGKIRWEFRL